MSDHEVFLCAIAFVEARLPAIALFQLTQGELIRRHRGQARSYRAL
jgi:hypothetical protein